VLLVRQGGEPVGLVALDVSAAGIERLMWQINQRNWPRSGL
jgi:hypothetical protein